MAGASAAHPLAAHVSRAGLSARVARAVESRALREVASTWLLTRFAFLLLTYFGVILFNSSLHGAQPHLAHALLPAWDQWDTKGWYIPIAQRGYAWHNPAGTSPTAFFPLYPLLLHVGMAVTHKSGILVALAVSNLCFLVALWYLYRLTAWELGADAARRTILAIAVFPTALFFFAGYTESPFLLFTVASFYHLRRHDWLAAGVWGGLASATRVTGVLLLLPFAYEYARSCNFSPRRMLSPGVLALALVPSGLLAFMLYLQHTVGNAMAFTSSQAAWQKVFTLRIWAGFFESLRQIVSVQPPATFFEAHNLINVGLGGLALIWTVMGLRRLNASYSLYTGAFWLTTLTTPALAHGYPVPLISLSRYVLTLFPVFMVVGSSRSRRFAEWYLVLSTTMLAVQTVQFLNGGWII